jgi:hypothetical protein
MGGLRPIGSEKLEGMDKIRRIMEIAKYNENIPNPVNENRNTEYTVKLADGNVYAIVREKLGYIIKSAVNENVTDYIEPIRERKYYRSYSEALKRLNLMTKELNTLYGNKKGVSLFEQDEKKKDKQYFLKTGNNQPKQETTPTPATPAPATPAPATPDMTAVAPATGATATAAPTTGGELGEQAVDPLAAPTTPATPATDPLATPVDPTAAPAADPLAAPADPLADPTAVPTDVPDTEMSMDTEEPEDDTEGGKGKKEEVTFKTIQKLTGRLSQKIRKYTEEEEMTSDDTKYIINSILSSLDLEALDDEDVDEIIDRLEGEEVEDEEGINPEDMMGDEMGTETGETPEPGLEGAPVAPEENTTTPPQPELEEGYDNLSDAFTGKFKGAFTAGVADQMAEESDDYPRHGAAGKRHKHLEHGTFGESKVDKIISSYFKIDENEILIKEEENRKKIQKNFNLTSKKIKNLSENISQERASLKFIEKYPTSNLLGKSKTGNLIFENKNKSYRISPIGKLL